MQRLGLASELAMATFEERSAGARRRRRSPGDFARAEARAEADRRERSFERTLWSSGRLPCWRSSWPAQVALLVAALAWGSQSVAHP